MFGKKLIIFIKIVGKRVVFSKILEEENVLVITRSVATWLFRWIETEYFATYFGIIRNEKMPIGTHKFYQIGSLK